MLSPERLAQDFINDHLHYLPGREQIVSGSAQQVESWFQGRVDFPVRVPDVPDAALQDARVCDISGRKAALLHYRHNPGDALISVFVAEEPKSFDRQMKGGTLVASNQGLNSTLWCHRGLVYDVVAPLDDATLQQIAESVRRQQP
jgi:anti-sigma factor RsiW